MKTAVIMCLVVWMVCAAGKADEEETSRLIVWILNLLVNTPPNVRFFDPFLLSFSPLSLFFQKVAQRSLPILYDYGKFQCRFLL